jgi:hypothetical protein
MRMVLRFAVLLSMLLVLGAGWAAARSIMGLARVAGVRAEVAPTSTRPPVPALPTDTPAPTVPEPTSTPEPAPPSDSDDSAPPPPPTATPLATATPVVPFLPESGAVRRGAGRWAVVGAMLSLGALGWLAARRDESGGGGMR